MNVGASGRLLGSTVEQSAGKLCIAYNLSGGHIPCSPAEHESPVRQRAPGMNFKTHRRNLIGQSMRLETKRAMQRTEPLLYAPYRGHGVFPGSSAVEQPAVNRLVAGSNPARGATVTFAL
jgi:hypothetical protein